MLIEPKLNAVNQKRSIFAPYIFTLINCLVVKRAVEMKVPQKMLILLQFIIALSQGHTLTTYIVNQHEMLSCKF